MGILQVRNLEDEEVRLEAIGVKCYRSIENIKIKFPTGKPVILFGPNNVGKSNLLKAMDIMLGEKFPTYTEFEDSDYFQRDKYNNGEIKMMATFDEPYHIKSSYNSTEEYKYFYFSSNRATKKGNEHIFHDGNNNQLYIKGETFILGIEEPESHLHPLAQRWLSKNIKKMCSEGLQVIITTHSPEFFDIEGLEGFVKVYKGDGVTKIVQNDVKKLSEKCIELGSDSSKTNGDSILKFYKSNTFYDQLKGFFARRILLVEGATEVFALPVYFERAGYDLIKNGTEIIDCIRVWG
jgi:predicted ATP-dependent endonuclease of OLD family